jgi:metallo-beta-lactamase family protein
VRAKIRRVEGYSAHADHDELTEWAVSTRDQGNLKGTFLVHGEPEAMTALSEALAERGLRSVTMPARGAHVDL